MAPLLTSEMAEKKEKKNRKKTKKQTTVYTDTGRPLCTHLKCILYAWPQCTYTHHAYTHGHRCIQAHPHTHTVLHQCTYTVPEPNRLPNPKELKEAERGRHSIANSELKELQGRAKAMRQSYHS